MKTIERYKGKRLSKKLNVPYEIERLWLAGCYAFKNREQGRCVIMPYFDKRTYVEHKVGDIVPVFRLKTGVVYYKILHFRRYPGSDPAMFDDQREYDLVFHHHEPKKTAT